MTKLCGAKNRSGSLCKRAPAKGRNRCKLHGGATLQGKNAPNYKHGLYSKYLGPELNEVLRDIDETGEDIFDSSQDIKLTKALVFYCHQILQDRVGEIENTERVTVILERLTKMKQRSQALEIERKKLIPISEIEGFLKHISDVLNNHFDLEKVSLLLQEIRSFKTNC